MIYKHELKTNIKSLFIWTLIMALVDFVFMIAYPSLEDAMNQAMDAYSNMGAFTQAFGIDKVGINTAPGFYATYIGAMFCIGGSIYAAIFGVGLLSKEEGGHTGEFLYTLPVSRVRVVLLKFAAMCTLLAAFSAVCYLVGVLSFVCIGMDVPIKELTLYHASQYLMQIEVASIAYLVSALCKKVNMSAGLGIALVLYFSDMMLRVIEDVAFLKYITPFYYSNAADIFGGMHSKPEFYTIGIIVTAVCIVTTVIYYDRKNLAA